MTANMATSLVTIPTPAWLKRRMTRNLRLAARSRINRTGAAKAREIFVAAHVRGSTATSRSAAPDTTAQTQAAGAPDLTGLESPRTASIRRSTFSKFAHKAKAATAGLSHVAKMMAR